MCRNQPASLHLLAWSRIMPSTVDWTPITCFFATSRTLRIRFISSFPSHSGEGSIHQSRAIFEFVPLSMAAEVTLSMKVVSLKSPSKSFQERSCAWRCAPNAKIQDPSEFQNSFRRKDVYRTILVSLNKHASKQTAINHSASHR